MLIFLVKTCRRENCDIIIWLENMIDKYDKIQTTGKTDRHMNSRQSKQNLVKLGIDQGIKWGRTLEYFTGTILKIPKG